MAINPTLDGVFIHVSDMQRAITWYSSLLSMPSAITSHDGLIYALPLTGSTQVILDGYPKPVPPHGTGPRVMFTTSDIRAAVEHVRSLGIEPGEVQDIGSSLVLYIEDPDGNLICIRQPKHS